MLLVYSSGSILLLVLYSPLAFPLSLPPSFPALSRLCAHCTTKGWSQGCGIQAIPLMPVCVCVFITQIYISFFHHFIFPPLTAMSPYQTSPSSVNFFLNTTKHSEEAGMWKRGLGAHLGFLFCKTKRKIKKSKNKCICNIQPHIT